MKLEDMPVVTVEQVLRFKEEAIKQRDALSAVVERQREALDSIRQYGSDTLSGRIDGPDDRKWQRDSVMEMTKRAREALALTPATALRLHDAEVLERMIPGYEQSDNEFDKYVAKCLRYNAFRLRAGGEG